MTNRRHRLEPALAAWRHAPAALACLALWACSTTPPATSTQPWVSGRLSVRVAATATQAAQSESAAFELRGDATRGELRLNSPLGSRVAEARWAPGDAVLVTPDGAQRFADLDALSRQALGQALPLAALPDWLSGRPWPLAAHVLHDTGFDQLGWQVDLRRRDLGWIEARREAPPALTLRVKLDTTEAP